MIADGEVVIWEIAQGRARLKLVPSWRGDREPGFRNVPEVSDVAYSPDGSMISIGYRDPWVWEVATLRLRLPTKATTTSRPPSHRWVGLHAWSPEGRHIAALGIQGGLSILDTSSGRYVEGIPTAPDDHLTVESVRDLDWHPSGRVVTWVHMSRLWLFRLSDSEVISLAFIREPASRAGTALVIQGTFETVRTSREPGAPATSHHPPARELPPEALASFITGLPVGTRPGP